MNYLCLTYYTNEVKIGYLGGSNVKNLYLHIPILWLNRMHFYLEIVYETNFC